MTRCRSAIASLGLFTSMALGLSGCSNAPSGDPFQGAGEFTLALKGADGTQTAQRMPSHPQLLLRHGKRGGTDLVLDRLRACELPEADRDRFANGLYTLGKIMPARWVRTTFDELRDSGRLRLIGNAELRRALSETARVRVP